MQNIAEGRKLMQSNQCRRSKRKPEDAILNVLRFFSFHDLSDLIIFQGPVSFQSLTSFQDPASLQDRKDLISGSKPAPCLYLQALRLSDLSLSDLSLSVLSLSVLSLSVLSLSVLSLSHRSQ